MSDDAIERSMGLDQTMLAARQHDPARRVDVSRDRQALVRTIDGLQPDEGPETLDVVRALRSKRGWYAEPLRASATQKGPRLIVVARQWADRLAQPVRGGCPEKPEAFVPAIAAELPHPPHRDCHKHVLRDVAKPVLDRDSRAQVTMRSKVRGLRALERACSRGVGRPQPLGSATTDTRMATYPFHLPSLCEGVDIQDAMVFSKPYGGLDGRPIPFETFQVEVPLSHKGGTRYWLDIVRTFTDEPMTYAHHDEGNGRCQG